MTPESSAIEKTKYPLAVSLRTPVASSMRRKDHPSFPSATTCCFFSSLKTLLIPREPIGAPLGVNVPGFCYGRFSGDLTGRIWVTAEGFLPQDFRNAVKGAVRT